MKSAFAIGLALLAAFPAWASSGASEVACGCTAPVLRAAVLNTGGSADQPFAADRMAALGSELPQRAAEHGLDAICLTETRTPALRETALQAFRSDPGWHVFQPAGLSRAGCKNACRTNTTHTALGFTLPINKWVEYASLTPVPALGGACAQAASDAEYHSCLDQHFPFVRPLFAENQACASCISDPVPGESRISRIFKCTATFTDTDAMKCWPGDNNEAGATLISRLPLVETDYRALTLPPPPNPGWEIPQNIPGIAHWGVAYGKVQTASGPVHLFCASMATGAYGMAEAVAQQANATHSQEVLDFIRSKAGDQPAVLMADTGSGPAVVASPTGPAAARWGQNFAVLQGDLTDALLTNLNDAAQPQPAAACTFGCNSATPGDGRYVDHIMSTGRATLTGGFRANLCHRRGSLMFTAATVATPDGPVTPSEHFGVRTDLCLSQLRCDVNNDGSINRLDLALISRQRGRPIATVGEAYDGNGDGQITAADVQACTRQCTRPNCAVQ